MKEFCSRSKMAAWLPVVIMAAGTAWATAAESVQPVVYRLWLMDADGSNKTLLHENSTSQFTHPHPSPDGRLIAGVVYTEDLDGDGLRTENDIRASAIAVMNADGTGLRILSDIPGEVDSHPTWSPDGSQLLFTSSAGSGFWFMWDLYTINVDGTNRQALTQTPLVSEGDPHWGPDGRIAFIRGPFFDVAFGEPAQVYVMNADTTGLRQISQAVPGGDTLVGFATGPYDPVFDSSGTRLTWAEVPSDLEGDSRFGDFDLMVLDDSQAQPAEISGNATADLMPRWSPDGRRLLFWILFGREGDAWVGDDIYTINPDGTDRTNLTLDFDEVASMPDWLPDGRIIFTSVANSQ